MTGLRFADAQSRPTEFLDFTSLTLEEFQILIPPFDETVSIYVDHNHPLLQLKRALPWTALFEVMSRRWAAAGKNVDGRPGLSWDVSLYVPLVVLMLVKNLHARAMEAYLAENVVARVFIGRQADVRAQIRDHANIARAYVALGKAGIDEVNGLMLTVAKALGFADPSILSADTTAQELPIGYPNEPGILRGVAQRCGRALAKLKERGVVGVGRALEQVQTILRSVKEHHLFAKGKPEKRRVLTRLLTEVGQLVVYTRPMVEQLRQSRDRVTQSARATLGAMHEVAKRLIPQIVQWITTGVVAKGKIVHAGAGGVPRDLWGARHTYVDGLRPGWLCYGDPAGARPRGSQGDRHPAQRPRGVARCRGRPRDGPERARQDRRDHWHAEDGQIWVQQAQGTSVADAGDGRSPVYPLLQSEQVDAGPGPGRQMRIRGIGAGRTTKTAPIERQGGRPRGTPLPSKEFCDTPYLRKKLHAERQEDSLPPMDLLNIASYDTFGRVPEPCG